MWCVSSALRCQLAGMCTLPRKPQALQSRGGGQRAEGTGSCALPCGQLPPGAGARSCAVQLLNGKIFAEPCCCASCACALGFCGGLPSPLGGARGRLAGRPAPPRMDPLKARMRRPVKARKCRPVKARKCRPVKADVCRPLKARMCRPVKARMCRPTHQPASGHTLQSKARHGGGTVEA